VFGKTIRKYKINWKFSQRGNIWKIKFAGESVICGETRVMNSEEIYLYAVDIESGRIIMKDFVYEKNNFWITLEDASPEYIFLSRLEKPGMPNNKGIIALDHSGKKIWENEDLEFLYYTDESVVAYKQNFDTLELFSLKIQTGNIEKKYEPGQTQNIFGMREKIVSERYDEVNDYPVSLGTDTNRSLKEIFETEIKDNIAHSKPEFIERSNIVIFNYYKDSGSDIKDITKKNYINIICIYDKDTKGILYKDTLNENTSYRVPDNFFTKNGFLYYIRGKNELINIKL